MDITGTCEALYSGECRWGGGEHYICYERNKVEITVPSVKKVYVMSERQISMMVTENISNTITSTDFKGANIVCMEKYD